MRYLLKTALSVVLGAMLVASAAVVPSTPASAQPNCPEGDLDPACNGDPEPPGSHDPTGWLVNVVRQVDGVRVMGEAVDPSDVTKPVTVDIIIGGTVVGSVVANKPDSTGGSTGFDGLVPAHGGSQICAKARNIGPGSNQTIGCVTKTIKVDPYGAWESMTREGDKLRVKGWVIDPDTTGAAVVEAWVGVPTSVRVVADKQRTDVGAANPGYGDNHGFDALLTADLPAGEHSICLSVLNVGPGAHGGLGCKPYTVKGSVAEPSFTRVDVTDTMLRFHWAKDANADRYTVYLSEAGGQWVKQITMYDKPDSPEVELSNLKPDTDYCVRVVTSNDRPSEATGEKCAHTKRSSLPVASEVTVVDASDTTLTVRWKDNAEGEETYVLSYAVPDTNAKDISLPGSPGTGMMTYTITGLKPNSDYIIGVRPQHPLHHFTSSRYGYGATTGKPVISSFTTNYSQIGVCDPKDVSVTWKVTGATKVEVKQGDRVIGTATRETSDQWVETLDVGNNDGNVVYTLVAYSPSEQTATASARIIRHANYPLVNKVVVTNMGPRMLEAKLYDQYGNWVKDLGSFEPGQVFTTDPPRCRLSEVKIFRVFPVPTPTPAPTPPPAPRVELAWNSGVIIGHDDGTSMPGQTN